MPKLFVDWAKLQTAWEKIAASGHFTEGYYVKALEDEVSRWSGLHAVVVSSAGAGLFAMYKVAEDIYDNRGPVAVCNNTFFATGGMARQAGRNVKLIDCNRNDFCMDPTQLGHVLMDLSTVVVTQVGGGLARGQHIIETFAKQKGWMIFEDAAHALGVGEAGHTAGATSDGAVFSLYPTKAIPAGEGGIIVTRHADFADRLREFRNYGKYVEDGVIKYRGVGFNLRMDEWTAALAFLQMERRLEILEAREKAADQLKAIFDPMLDWAGGESNWYKFAVHPDEARELGVKRFTGKVYAYSDQLRQAMKLPGLYLTSEWVANNHVCLPLDEHIYDGMTKDQIIAYLRGE